MNERIVCLLVLGLAGCSTPQLRTQHTAAEEFSKLGSNHDKSIAKNFYDLGQGDAVKRWYWSDRDQQAYGSSGSADAKQPELQRKYVVLPVPEHVDPDGTVKESSNQVVEVVQ